MEILNHLMVGVDLHERCHMDVYYIDTSGLRIRLNDGLAYLGGLSEVSMHIKVLQAKQIMSQRGSADMSSTFQKSGEDVMVFCSSMDTSKRYRLARAWRALTGGITDFHVELKREE